MRVDVLERQSFAVLTIIDTGSDSLCTELLQHQRNKKCDNPVPEPIFPSRYPKPGRILIAVLFP
jgi:hypothetical protein